MLTPMTAGVAAAFAAREQRDRVSAIIWRGKLPADHFDGFGLMVKLPNGASGPLYLPVRQTCGDATVTWGEIPASRQSWGSLRHPAPMITLEAASASHRH